MWKCVSAMSRIDDIFSSVYGGSYSKMSDIDSSHWRMGLTVSLKLNF